jgi:hypothetical protein
MGVVVLLSFFFVGWKFEQNTFFGLSGDIMGE